MQRYIGLGSNHSVSSCYNDSTPHPQAPFALILQLLGSMKPSFSQATYQANCGAVPKSPDFSYKINNLVFRYSLRTKPTTIICAWIRFPFLYSFLNIHFATEGHMWLDSAQTLYGTIVQHFPSNFPNSRVP